MPVGDPFSNGLRMHFVVFIPKCVNTNIVFWGVHSLDKEWVLGS